MPLSRRELLMFRDDKFAISSIIIPFFSNIRPLPNILTFNILFKVLN